MDGTDWAVGGGDEDEVGGVDWLGLAWPWLGWDHCGLFFLCMCVDCLLFLMMIWLGWSVGWLGF